MTSPLNDRTDWPWMPQSLAAPRPATAAPLPRISIITPSFNQGKFIEETIRSILLQDYPNLEYIVIDGGSTDNTVEVIKRYASRLDYWESEKDRGQSHAINKGIARCTGQIFNWINSDDQLAPDALWTVARAWMANPGAIIAGRMQHFDENGSFRITPSRGQTLRNFIRPWEAGTERGDFVWNQQATFIPLKDLQAIDGVREDLHYCMDYHMMVRLLAKGLRVVYLEDILSRFRYHPLSKTNGPLKDSRLELINALRSIPNLPVTVEPWEWDAEQARRIVDVARQAVKIHAYSRAAKLLFRAVRTNPKGAINEITRRVGASLRRRTGTNPMQPVEAASPIIGQ